MEKYTRRLPLAFEINDGHVTVRCTAAPEVNGGESCVWHWRVTDGNVDSAIRHAVERHLPHIPYPQAG